MTGFFAPLVRQVRALGAATHKFSLAADAWPGWQTLLDC